jgi:hypothetical protein
MQFIDPKKVICHFGLQQGMSVVDFHPGSGFFRQLLKESVGVYGKVHEGYDSIPEKVDCALIINIPSDVKHHEAFTSAYEKLKPQGKMIFISWNTGGIDRERVTTLAGLAGFLHERRFNAGDAHMGLVFKKV